MIFIFGAIAVGVIVFGVTAYRRIKSEKSRNTTVVPLPLSPIYESAVEVESIHNQERDPELISTEINEAYQSRKEFIETYQNEAYESRQAVRGDH